MTVVKTPEVEVFDQPRPGRKRRYSTSQKQAILDEAAQAGNAISAVARKYGIWPSLMFRWKKMQDVGALAGEALVEHAPAHASRQSTFTRFRFVFVKTKNIRSSPGSWPSASTTHAERPSIERSSDAGRRPARRASRGSRRGSRGRTVGDRERAREHGVVEGGQHAHDAPVGERDLDRDGGRMRVGRRHVQERHHRRRTRADENSPSFSRRQRHHASDRAETPVRFSCAAARSLLRSQPSTRSFHSTRSVFVFVARPLQGEPYRVDVSAARRSSPDGYVWTEANRRRPPCAKCRGMRGGP
jgi:hypothetical protein